MSNRFCENQPNEICSHLSEKASQVRFLKPEKFQNHSNEGKGKKKKKERGEGREEKRRKSNGCTLSFYITYFGYSFLSKKLLDAKDPFGDYHNVFKNPARCSWSLIGYSSCDGTIPFCGSTQTLVPGYQVWTAPKSS